MLVIKKCGTVEAKKQLEEDTRKKEEADLEDKIGMTALIQALSDSVIDGCIYNHANS